jgi:hypothetical protein
MEFKFDTPLFMCIVFKIFYPAYHTVGTVLKSMKYSKQIIDTNKIKDNFNYLFYFTDVLKKQRYQN